MCIRDSLCTDILLKVRDNPNSPRQEAVRKSLSSGIGCLADSLALTGHACKDLSQKRRDVHRLRHPSHTSVGIRAPHVPMSADWLYPHGTEFHKSLKEAREIQKLGQDIREQNRRGQGPNQWFGQKVFTAQSSLRQRAPRSKVFTAQSLETGQQTG